MDKFKLIAEVRKRPFLWQNDCRRSRAKTQYLWDEIAECLGVDVMMCKTKWAQLRTGYRDVKRRCKQRLEWVISKGIYDPKLFYGSKWIYFEHMKFLNTKTKRKSNKSSKESDTESSDEDSIVEIEIRDNDQVTILEEINDSEVKSFLEKCENVPTSNNNPNLPIHQVQNSFAIDNISVTNDKESSKQNAQRNNVDILPVYIKKEPESSITDEIYPASINRSHDSADKQDVTEIKLNRWVQKSDSVPTCTKTQNKVQIFQITNNLPRENVPVSEFRKQSVQPVELNVFPIYLKKEPEFDVTAEEYLANNKISYDYTGNQYNTKTQCVLEKTETSVQKTKNYDELILPTAIQKKNVEQTCSNQASNQYARLNISCDIFINPVTDTITPINTTSGGSFDRQEVSLNLPLSKRRQVTDSISAPGPSPKNSNNGTSDKNIVEHNMPQTYTNEIKNPSPPNSNKSYNEDFIHIKEEPVDKMDNIETHTDINIHPVPGKTINDANNQKFSKTYIDDLDCNFLVSFLSHMKSMTMFQNLKFRAEMSNLILSFYTSENATETNQLENQEISCLLKALLDIGDTDCNFLISFLPHMKSMSGVQNLQFRAKMSDIILNIFYTAVPPNNVFNSMQTS